ncbi:sarcosine oxidase subunit gamma [Rhodospirillum sp. A1_3_36]|uniref:sarcosine oxidase subunit gamma n=1 Tax=Rhodospirillum sp. A1_3_36 TaxID=3391666 RepID=UPI0039A78340
MADETETEKRRSKGTSGKDRGFDPLAADWRDRLFQSSTATIQVDAAPWQAQLTLRGAPEDRTFAQAVEAVTGLRPPSVANTLTADEQKRLLWLGPDEGLLLAPQDQGASLLAGLKAAFAALSPETNALALDTSESRRAVDVWGPDAIQLLERGCALDLHPRAFPIGRCAQSLLAGIPVLIAHLPRRNGANHPCLRVFARTSMVRHLAWWLVDALAEFRRSRI